MDLTAYAITDARRTPGSFPLPPDAARIAGAPQHYKSCTAIVIAADSMQAENMLAQRGLRVTHFVARMAESAVGSYAAGAMRDAGLFAAPSVWLLVFSATETGQVVIQVTEDGNMFRVGSVVVEGNRAAFVADAAPSSPVGIDPAMVKWAADRHRDAVAKAIGEAISDLSLLPTKMVRGGMVASELSAIIGRLVDAAGRARALEVLGEISPK